MGLPVLFIVGPTAVGKSALAVHLALRFGGEIVNADSRQVYRGMDIGTAKPLPDDRARVPHHLIDIVEPDQEFSLARFLELARSAIQDIHGRGGLPIVAGGTGQYVWALLEGWQVPEVPPDPRLRRDLEEMGRREGPDALYKRLRDVDPEAASRIDPRNQRRVIRGLEIYHAAGSTAPSSRRKRPPPYLPFVIGLTLERNALYDRIDRRVDEMLERGLVPEVKELLRTGYSPDLPCMSSMGYREVALFLQGELTLDEAAQRAKYETHRFARRQHTWFRSDDSRIRWLEAAPGVDLDAVTLVEDFLRGPAGVVK